MRTGMPSIKSNDKLMAMKFFLDTSALWDVVDDPDFQHALSTTPEIHVASSITALELVRQLVAARSGVRPQAKKRFNLFLRIARNEYLLQPQYFIHQRLFSTPSHLPTMADERIAYPQIGTFYDI